MQRHRPIVRQAGERHIVRVPQHEGPKCACALARRELPDNVLEASNADQSGRPLSPRSYIDLFAVASSDPNSSVFLWLGLLDERPDPGRGSRWHVGRVTRSRVLKLFRVIPRCDVLTGAITFGADPVRIVQSNFPDTEGVPPW